MQLFDLAYTVLTRCLHTEERLLLSLKWLLLLRTVPCIPGTYIEYKYSYKDKQNPRCAPCPVGYYQEQYATDECVRCPMFAVTRAEASDSIDKCVGKQKLHYSFQLCFLILCYTNKCSIIIENSIANLISLFIVDCQYYRYCRQWENDWGTSNLKSV